MSELKSDTALRERYERLRREYEDATEEVVEFLNVSSASGYPAELTLAQGIRAALANKEEMIGRLSSRIERLKLIAFGPTKEYDSNGEA